LSHRSSRSDLRTPAVKRADGPDVLSYTQLKHGFLDQTPDRGPPLEK